MRSMGLLMLLLSTFMSISMLPAASANDEAALLAFKAAAISSSGYGDQLASLLQIGSQVAYWPTFKVVNGCILRGWFPSL